MIPIVNEKYKYILFYNPKSACTSVRKLFLHIHIDELNNDDRSRLDQWHNLSAIFKYSPQNDYSSYKTINVVRNPYNRVVSGFLSIFVNTIKNNRFEKRIQKTLLHIGKAVGKCEMLDVSFSDLIVFLQDHGIEILIKKFKEPHFQEQSVYYALPERGFTFNYICRVETLKHDLLKAFAGVFGDHEKLFNAVKLYISDEFKVENYTRMSDSDNYFHNVPIKDLLELPVLPSYKNFLPNLIMEKVERIYERDFATFHYSIGGVDSRSYLDSYLPDDFEVNVYLELNPELVSHGTDTEEKVKLHYINHGRYEKRAYK